MSLAHREARGPGVPALSEPLSLETLLPVLVDHRHLLLGPDVEAVALPQAAEKLVLAHRGDARRLCPGLLHGAGDA